MNKQNSARKEKPMNKNNTPEQTEEKVVIILQPRPTLAQWS